MAAVVLFSEKVTYVNLPFPEGRGSRGGGSRAAGVAHTIPHHNPFPQGKGGEPMNMGPKELEKLKNCRDINHYIERRTSARGEALDRADWCGGATKGLHAQARARESMGTPPRERSRLVRQRKDLCAKYRSRAGRTSK